MFLAAESIYPILFQRVCSWPPLPTLRQLQFFMALIRRQSFSKAADDCFVSQSTLSSAIKEMEMLLGRQLVDRSTRSFALTPAGEEVARARGGDSRRHGGSGACGKRVAVRSKAGVPSRGDTNHCAPFMLPEGDARSCIGRIQSLNSICAKT